MEKRSTFMIRLTKNHEAYNLLHLKFFFSKILQFSFVRNCTNKQFFFQYDRTPVSLPTKTKLSLAQFVKWKNIKKTYKYDKNKYLSFIHYNDFIIFLICDNFVVNLSRNFVTIVTIPCIKRIIICKVGKGKPIHLSASNRISSQENSKKYVNTIFFASVSRTWWVRKKT